jgi:hypothetical protein
VAATLTGADELTWLSFPIEKTETTPDGDIIVYGKASDGSVDSDEQIVDPKFSGEAIKEWLNTGPNVRVQHQPQRDPAGVGLEMDTDPDGGHWVKSLIVEPVAKKLVNTGALRAYSVGISHAHIVRDSVAKGGRIVGGEIVEISLVDRPANKNCGIQLVKADNKGVMEYVGKVFGSEATLLKYDVVPAPKMVELTLPADVSVAFSPTDMAKILARKGEGVKAAPTPMGSGPGASGTTSLSKDDEPDEEKAAPTAAGSGPGMASATSLSKDEEDTTEYEKATEPDEAKRDFDPNVGGGVDRDKIPESDFAGRGRSFPITNQSDVSDALQSLGRAGKDNYSREKIRRNIIRIARRKGLTVPESASKKPKKAKKADSTAEVNEAKPSMTKKKKVMCPGCGAMQNSKHNHCSECGKGISPHALPVEKNHDYLCLGCGKKLDKGEKYCPGCGKENPGYLPEADRKIEANKAERGRVAKAKKKKGKSKDKKEPFGGRQAPAFGKDKMPEAKKAKKGKKSKGARTGKSELESLNQGGGFGESPTPGHNAVGDHGERSVPEHREPDGEAVEALERDMHIPTNKGAEDPEMAAAIRLKSLGVPRSMGLAHDMCCPAYDWADVSKAYPGAHFGLLDLSEWQQKAADAVALAPLAEAASLAQLLQHASTLKTTTMDELLPIRQDMFKAFRDANPGPGSFPSPGGIHPASYNRPYISAGHGAASPGYAGPNKAPVPAHTPDANNFERGYIQEGHAADAPANHGAGSPVSKPSQSGKPESALHVNVGRGMSGARSAMNALHDHVANSFPGVCPMSPAAPGVTGDRPSNSGAPPVGGIKKSKNKDAVTGKAVSPDGMTKKQRKKLKKKLAKQVLRGKVSPDTARTQLGMKPPKTGTTVPRKGFGAVKKTIKREIQKAMQLQQPAEIVKSEGTPVVPVLGPADIANQVRKANGQFARRVEKELKAQRKMLNALANQPDPSTAPFVGVAQNRFKSQTIERPAGAASVAEVAERTQLALLRDLQDKWRNSPDPGTREEAWQELRRRTLDTSATKQMTNVTIREDTCG